MFLAAPSCVPKACFDFLGGHADAVVGYGDSFIIDSYLDHRLEVIVKRLSHADSIECVLGVLSKQGERRLVNLVGEQLKHARELELESDPFLS